MNGLAASRPSATTVSVGALAPPSTSSRTLSVASASTIMIATSSPALRPATTMSNTAPSSCSTVGNATHWPLMSATRTPPTGPENGSPEIWVDADAALMASTSYRSLGSRLRIVTTTWISLRRPETNVGRSGRSMSRQVRIASVDGLPSRRKNDPGIRPAAYIRSSTSIVKGKKSKWSFGVLLAVVALSSMVSSSRYATTAPAACWASRPVSKRMVRVPKLPLSIVAVDSNTPSSISATDMCVRAASLDLFSYFAQARATRRVPGQPDGCRVWMRRRPSIEAADLPQSGELGSHYRRPRDTDLSSFGVLLCLVGTVRADRARRTSFGPMGPRTTLTLHADLAIPSTPDDDAAWAAARGIKPLGAGSAAQAQPLDQRAVARHVDLGDIFEQTAPTSDQQQ